MSGIAATSMLGLAGQHGSGQITSLDPITDPELFGKGSSRIRLAIEGIQASSSREGDFIEGYAWGWDMAVPEDLGGQADVGALTLLKAVDETTPQLMESLVSGRAHPRAVLSVFTDDTSGRALETLRITMEPVRIISVLDQGRIDFGTHPEKIAMVFQKATVTHPESGNEFSWSMLGE